MLTNIESIPVSIAAIEMFPESVAMRNSILPVGVFDGILHLAVPSDCDLIDPEVFDKLQFILGHSFTYEFADGKALAEAVRFHYLAAISTIRNCEVKIAYRCPLQWNKLQATKDRQIRHCQECGRSVIYCLTADDLARESAAGHCVAFFETSEEEEVMGLIDYGQ